MDQSIKQTLSTICRAVSVIAIGLTIVGTSCSHNKSDSGSFVEIEGVNVSLSGDVADAVIIYSNIDNLYMRHSKSSPLLSCFGIDGDSIFVRDRLITMGSGPCEMLSLMLYSVSPSEHKIVFFDPNTRRVLECNTDDNSLSDNSSYMCTSAGANTSRFAVGHPRGTLVTYISMGDTPTAGVVGLISKEDSAFIPLKGVGTEAMGNLTLQGQIHYAPNSQIFVQPGGEKCLFVSSTGQYAEIFEIKGDQADNKKVLVDNVPSFSLNERGRIATASDELKLGFKVCVTSDRVYLAPLRATYNELKDGVKDNPKYTGPTKGADFCDEIWEYDWDGNALTKYKLSPGFSSFTVSPSHILWANSEDDDYEGIIMRYELSKK